MADDRSPTLIPLPDAMPRLSRLGIGYQRAWQLVSRGQLRSERIGGRWYVNVEAIAQLEAERAKSPGPEMLSVRQACLRYGVSREALLRAVLYGELTITRDRTKLIVSDDDVRTWSERRAQQRRA
jgi:hypothetical protein